MNWDVKGKVRWSGLFSNLLHERMDLKMDSIRNRLGTHPYATLFVLALLVRLGAFASQLPELEKPLVKDAFVYREIAASLAAGQGYNYDNQPTAITTPLYPVFLAALFELPGSGIWTVVLIQELLGALTVLLLFRIGTTVGGKRLAWIAGIVGALYWPLGMVATRLITETLFIFLMLAGSLFLVEYFREGCLRNALLAGILLGLACLARGVLMYFAVLAGVWIFVRGWTQNPRMAVASSALFLGSFALVMAPWVVRNKVVLGTFAPGGTNTGMVLYTGNFPEQGRIFGMNLRPHQLPAESRHILDLPEVRRDQALKNLAIQRIKQEPLHVAKMVVKKALFFWVPVDWEILGHGEGTFNPWYFWIVVFGLLWLFRGKITLDWLVPFALVAYFSLISLAAYGSPRLRLPVEPFIILAGAGGWLEFERRINSTAARAAALSIIVVMGATAYIRGYQLKEAAAGFLSALGLW